MSSINPNSAATPAVNVTVSDNSGAVSEKAGISADEYNLTQSNSADPVSLNKIMFPPPDYVSDKISEDGDLWHLPQQTTKLKDYEEYIKKFDKDKNGLSKEEIEQAITKQKPELKKLQESVDKGKKTIERLEELKEEMPGFFKGMINMVIGMVKKRLEKQEAELSKVKSQLAMGRELYIQFDTYAGVSGNDSDKLITQNDVKELAGKKDSKDEITHEDLNVEYGQEDAAKWKKAIQLADTNGDGLTQQEVKDYVDGSTKKLEDLRKQAEAEKDPKKQAALWQQIKDVKDASRVLGEVNYEWGFKDIAGASATDGDDKLTAADIDAIADNDGDTSTLSWQDRSTERQGTQDVAQIVKVRNAIDKDNNGATQEEIDAYIKENQTKLEDLKKQAAANPDLEKAYYQMQHAVRENIKTAENLRNQFYTLKEASDDDSNTVSEKDIREMAGRDGDATKLGDKDYQKTWDPDVSLAKLKEAHKKYAGDDGQFNWEDSNKAYESIDKQIRDLEADSKANPANKVENDKKAYALRQERQVLNKLNNIQYNVGQASTDDSDSLSIADLDAAAKLDGKADDLSKDDIYLLNRGTTNTKAHVDVLADADGQESPYPIYYLRDGEKELHTADVAKSSIWWDPNQGDVKKDGKISRRELYNQSSDYYQQIQDLKDASTKDPSKKAENDKKIYDLNQKIKTTNRIIQNFDKLDTNKDGSVTADELKKVATSKGSSRDLSDEELGVKRDENGIIIGPYPGPIYRHFADAQMQAEIGLAEVVPTEPAKKEQKEA